MSYQPDPNKKFHSARPKQKVSLKEVPSPYLFPTPPERVNKIVLFWLKGFIVVESSEDSQPLDGSSKIGNFPFLNFGHNWVKFLSTLVIAITPVFTGINTFRVEMLTREVDKTQYFQKEIKESLEKLSDPRSENANISLAALYALADNYDKKRILISIASTRLQHDLDEPIAYLVLSEDKKTRAKIIENNPSLRDIARRLEVRQVQEIYSSRSDNPIENEGGNADIRPNITNGSTQLMSLYSSKGMEGWILLGRFPKSGHEELIKDTNRSLDTQLYAIESQELMLQTEGAVIDFSVDELVKDFKGKSKKITSPIYVRQSPPSLNYDLPMLAENRNTAIMGVLCQGDQVSILEYKPVKPRDSYYTLWGRIRVENSRPCYSPGEESINGVD